MRGKLDTEMAADLIMLNPEVYRQLASETAPFDTRASRFLLTGRSVLAYDIYVWLVGTLHGMKKPMTFSWDWLYERFGYGMRTQRNFRSKFRRALEKGQMVYPEAHVCVSICFASMSFQQAHQYFSAVWADGFPRSRHHAVSDVR